MTGDERTKTYIDSLSRDHTGFLLELEEMAARMDVPIIRRETQNFLKTILAAKQPRRALEVGTAIGFSAILFCTYGPPDFSIVTIENYDKRIPLARENFARSGFERKITFLNGDAGELLPGLLGPFDLIFMDAAKGQYLNWLPEIKRLLAPGGILLSDNVLQDGDLIESRYLVERRKRTIHKRMREYLFALTHDPQLSTCVLRIGDGIAFTVKEHKGIEERDSE